MKSTSKYTIPMQIITIPKDAVIKELVVSKTGRCDRRMGMAYVYLPAALIGRKVTCIVFEESEEN